MKVLNCSVTCSDIVISYIMRKYPQLTSISVSSQNAVPSRLTSRLILREFLTYLFEIEKVNVHGLIVRQIDILIVCNAFLKNTMT
jgi:hypothetical protein